jgi:serine/threonine-protein kinase RsbW
MTAAESLNHSVAAEAASVGLAREEFSRWLRQFRLDDTRHSDLVLAVNEALANSAEFAYAHHHCPGVVRLQADYDPAVSSIAVTITDEGAWREPRPGANPQYRGRGIPLMQALSDEATIETSTRGTSVHLRFDNVGDLRTALL